MARSTTIAWQGALILGLLVQAAHAQAPASQPSATAAEPVRVSIHLEKPAQAVYTLAGRRFDSPAELFKAVKRRAEADTPILIQPAGDVPWRDVLAAFQEAVKAGFKQVGFAPVAGRIVPPPVTTTTAPAKRKVIKVRSAQELVEAIGSDRIIRLAPGTYKLSDVRQRDLKHVYWEKIMDGWDLYVRGVSNLRMELGHEPRPGFCTGGVLRAYRCRNLTLRKCVLFGCGTYGLSLQEVNGLIFEDSAIRNCTYGILSARLTRGMVFRRSRFHDSGRYSGFTMNACGPATMTECHVERNLVRTTTNEKQPLFQVGSGTELTLRKCKILRNRYAVLADPPAGLKMVGCEVRDNSPPPPGDD
jgi:biopolymer transport protein ExbD